MTARAAASVSSGGWLGCVQSGTLLSQDVKGLLAFGGGAIWQFGKSCLSVVLWFGGKNKGQKSMSVAGQNKDLDTYLGLGIKMLAFSQQTRSRTKTHMHVALWLNINKSTRLGGVPSIGCLVPAEANDFPDPGAVRNQVGGWWCKIIRLIWRRLSAWQWRGPHLHVTRWSRAPHRPLGPCNRRV